MDASEQAQIERILAHEFDLALRGTQQDIYAILSANSAKGSIRSGATVIQVCQAISERYCSLVASSSATVAEVNASPEAFAYISNGFDAALPDLEVEIRKIANIVSGRSSAEAIPSILKAALDRFEQFRLDLKAKLEITRFSFARKPAPPMAPTPSVRPVNAPPPDVSTLPANRGGKPLAAHWNDMWSSIAVQLWTGDLKPQSQADVKRAMLDWFNANEIDIGDTAVTERARQLWRKMVAAS